MSGSDGVVNTAISALRQCANFVLPGVDYPKLDRNVQHVLSNLEMTPRHVRGLYRNFTTIQSHDSLTADLGPDECSTEALLRLVRFRRQWVAKILRNLMELGGYTHAVSWNGFLYVLLKFCALSRMELGQVMFFIIAREMKSWTVHYVTTAQLEEFYEDYEDCPFSSFNTRSINFSSLSMAKIPMVAFIELTYRFSQLINPMLHLQRSLQQSLPNMEYWRNYDKVKLRNNQITLDYFRIQKVTTLLDVVRTMQMAKNGHVVEEQKPIIMDMDDVEWVDPKIDPLDPRTQVRRIPHVEADLPIPLPGPGPNGETGPPGWIPSRRGRPPAQAPVPAWIMEKNSKNCDPIRHIPLGSAAYTAPPPNWALPLETSLTVASAKAAIQATHKDLAAALSPEELLAKAKAEAAKKDRKGEMDAMLRNQELDFIRKSRGVQPQRQDMIKLIDGVTQCELISRAPKKKIAVGRTLK